jgi:hypothetical protein
MWEYNTPTNVGSILNAASLNDKTTGPFLSNNLHHFRLITFFYLTLNRYNASTSNMCETNPLTLLL